MKTILPLLLLLANVAVAQIPNADFENWASMGGYNNPNGWGQLNSGTYITSVETIDGISTQRLVIK